MEIKLLFPKILGVNKLNTPNHLKKEIKKHYTNIDFDYTYKNTKDKVYRSHINVLSDYKYCEEFKQLLQKQIDLYTNEVMKLKNKFIITTSWFTKTEKNAQINYHRHANCMFSGVYYPEQKGEIANIVFNDFHPQSSFICAVNECNGFNTDEFKVKPLSDLLILFPASLYHKVEKNLYNTRYSLAFNCIPTGDIGIGDSFIRLNI